MHSDADVLRSMRQLGDVQPNLDAYLHLC
jgi:hypothetical protein